MVCFTFKRSALFVPLAGLLLRALTPLGYMPAAPGSGLLFELCPDQVPPGFVLQDADKSAHHHHNGNSDDARPSAESDQCQIGHLLFSAVAADPAVTQISDAPAVAEHFIPLIQAVSRLTVSVYQPRAPPHLSNKQLQS
jgi:hypothetical protein